MRYELRPKVARRCRSCKLPQAHERSLTISSTTKAYVAGLLGTIIFRLRLRSVCRRCSDSVREVVSLYLIDLQKLSPETGSPKIAGSVPISGTFPFWTHQSLCFEAYPAVKMALYPLQGHYLLF
jgi:hypothetical protein